MTQMYNVLEELRAGTPLSPASEVIHDRGLVSVLKDIQDDLDRAVAEAYGWPSDLAAEDILFRIVELNAARAAEERAGQIGWLRPEFQTTGAIQPGLGVELEEAEVQPARVARKPLPDTLPERVRAIHDFLLTAPAPARPEAIARTFLRVRSTDVTAILDTLVALGQATQENLGYHI